MNQYYARKLRLKANRDTRWTTTAGQFKTTYTTKVELSMPELHERRLIKHKFHITPNEMGYNMIIGQDLMEELGIDLNFSNNSISWDEAEINRIRSCMKGGCTFFQVNLVWRTFPGT